MKYLLKTTILLLLTCTLSHAENTLSLKFAGEAFEGPPVVNIKLDGKVISEFEIKSSIATDSGNSRLDRNDFDAYTDSTDISLDDASSGKELSLQLVKDNWGGKGSNQDRNAYLVGASWNGTPIPLTDFTIKSGDEVKPPQKKIISLGSTSVTATLKIPAIAKMADKTTSKDTKKEIADAKTCKSEDFYVTGFSKGATDSNSITKIADKIKKLSGGNVCAITITGYASKLGPSALNMTISKERAQWVESKLKASGIDLSRTTVKGAGETDKFGKTAENRRVVISVK